MSAGKRSGPAKEVGELEIFEKMLRRQVMAVRIVPGAALRPLPAEFTYLYMSIRPSIFALGKIRQLFMQADGNTGLLAIFAGHECRRTVGRRGNHVGPAVNGRLVDDDRRRLRIDGAEPPVSA